MEPEKAGCTRVVWCGWVGVGMGMYRGLTGTRGWERMQSVVGSVLAGG